MPRKETRTASSAAAAQLSSTPAFTSFAAATAHALPSYADQPPTPASAWDVAALRILKRLSKRDATTKLRAFADLTGHLASPDAAQPDAGPAFLSAWGPAFRAALADDAPPVRVAALALMPRVIRALRRQVQPVFPSVLPAWLAALGDPSPAVADAAAASVDDALPTAAHRAKVVARYADHLRRHCVHALAALSDADFVPDARRILAVLMWLLRAARSSDVIAPVIDDPANPLRRLAKGPKKSEASAASHVCNLAIEVVSHMSVHDPTHTARARRFADIAILAIRGREPAGWDLVLVLLRSGWHDAFGEEFMALSSAVCDAVTAPVPTGMHALLPLVDALPPRPSSVLVASPVLRGMHDALGVADVADDNLSINVSYALTALAAYIETAAFVHSVAARRWLDDDPPELERFQGAAFGEHVSPSCCLFLSGALPPVSKSHLGVAANGNGAKRRVASGASAKLVKDLATAFARVLRLMDNEQVAESFPRFANAFVTGLNENTYEDHLQRFGSLVNDLQDIASERALVLATVRSVMKASALSTEVSLRALAVMLSMRSVCTVEDNGDSQARLRVVATEMISYVTPATESLSETGPLLGQQSAAAVVGAIWSWIYWVHCQSNQQDALFQIISSLKMTRDDDTYHVLAALIRAHRARKDDGCVSAWVAVQGKELEAAVETAIVFSGQVEGQTSATFFLASVVDPKGGAALPSEIVRDIAAHVATKLKNCSSSDESDDVILSLLHSPLCHSWPDDTFLDLTAASILRAAKSEAVLAALTEQIGSRTTSNMVMCVSKMIKVLQESSERYRQGVDGKLFGRAVAKVIAVVGENSMEDSVSLCDQLLVWASDAFVADFLQHIPFRFVFGDGSTVMVHVDRFLATVETSYSRNRDKLVPLSENFLETIGGDERARLGAAVAEQFLVAGTATPSELLRMLHAKSEKRLEREAIFQLISGRISRHFPFAGEASKEGDRVADLVYLCVALSNGACLEAFKQVLTEAAAIVRKDAFGSKAGISIDILSSALGFVILKGQGSDELSRPTWLLELVALVLRSVRRSFEQSFGAKPSQLLMLETHGALLMRSAVLYFGCKNLSQDDTRFWMMKSKDTLRNYVHKASTKREADTVACARIVAVSNLVTELVRAGEYGDLPGSGTVFIDDVCHFAAWSGVCILPIVEAADATSAVQPSPTDSSSSKSSCVLILKAAERDVLLSKDSQFPVRRERVYELVPYLQSRSSLTRKAVLTVLTHAATVDLPHVVGSTFPENGFKDEAEELGFATNAMPQELRALLRWPTDADGHAEPSSTETFTKELGCFLAWRLFLDLIRTDDTSSSGATSEALEDMSFRRVGVTYLRSNPTLYAEFFSRCVDVVVDGSAKEKRAASASAAEALKVEEIAAQGIQLARQEEEEPEEIEYSGDAISNLVSDDCDMEVEVGHAAGIAFARALQRLPALSRQHVTDSLDRGTALRMESFVRKKISPLLIGAEIRKVKEWGSFGGGAAASSSGGNTGEGELHAQGSVAGREVWAKYTFSDVTLEIGMRLPDVFPLQTVEVEARSRIGMSEARWRKTLLGMTTLLRAKDGTLAEAVELWRRNLDKTFQGAEECPICYSVLHLSTAALPRMQCRTCKNLFHSDCLCKWFTKSNSSACPLCRSAF